MGRNMFGRQLLSVCIVCNVLITVWVHGNQELQPDCPISTQQKDARKYKYDKNEQECNNGGDAASSSANKQYRGSVDRRDKPSLTKQTTMTDTEMEHKPKLIVFDLDYTLWPFWIDTHVDPPFRKEENGKVRDSRGAHVKHYPEVPEVLQSLHNQGYQLGIASRTGAIQDAKELVKLFDWHDYFHFSEIYPGNKKAHFSKFHEHSKIPYEEMLFFDDEGRNIIDIKKLGVTSILVEDGVSKAVLRKGLKAFSDKKRTAK